MNPSGINPNDLDDFDEIKRQINNLNKVTGRVSWKTVQKLSKKILSTQGKDFRCSCYLTVAATHNDGLKGLVEGLNSLLDLCVIYWYTAYPDNSKVSARVRVIEWMVEYTEKRLRKHRAQPEERPLIEAAHHLCLRIEEELRFHYGDNAPSFARIRRLLHQWIEALNEVKITSASSLENRTAATQAKKLTSTSTAKPKVHKSPNTNGLVTYCFIGLLVIAYISLLAHEQSQYQTQKNQIAHASLPELSAIVDSLSLKNASQLISLKTPAVERLEVLMTNWTLDPVKVSQARTLDKLTEQLIKIYPDSSSAQQLRGKFIAQRLQLEAEFEAIYKRFTSARTVFANIAKRNADSDSAKAYEYSNSLFPLLGRIEYAQTHKQQKNVERSLHLLNTYLYKINQLQNSETIN